MDFYDAVIIDDEQSARNILANLLKANCPKIRIVDNCSDLEKGVKSIKKNNPSLVFLDIEMPRYSGYEIDSFFNNISFEIIFVTAYDSYAIRAFELSAVDYLLKPIEIDRLKEAVKRFIKKESTKKTVENYEVLLESLGEEIVQKIIVQVPNGQVVLGVNEIIAIQANESYSKILTLDENTYTYSKNLKYFEEILDKNKNFIRTHKSWIINKRYLISYSKSKGLIEMEKKITAKLSKYRKAEFENEIRT